MANDMSATMEQAIVDISQLPTQWARIRNRLQGEVGELEYRNWLRQMTLAGIDGDEITVLLPTRFLCDWVRSRYGDRLNSLWHAENPAVRRVDIRVGGGVAPMTGLAESLATTARTASRGPEARGTDGSAPGTDDRSSLHLRSLRGRQAQRIRLRLRTPGRRAAIQRRLQSAVPVRRRRPRQDASDARDRLGTGGARQHRRRAAGLGRLHVGREVHVPLHRRDPQPVDHAVQGTAPQRRRADDRRSAVPDRQGQHAGRVLPHVQRAGGCRQADRGVGRQVAVRPVGARRPAAHQARLRHGGRSARHHVRAAHLHPRGEGGARRRRRCRPRCWSSWRTRSPATCASWKAR